MSKFGARLRKHKHIFLYTAAAFLISALIAGGVSLLQSDDYLPSLDGDISAIAVTDNTILCAVSRDQDSLLLRMDTNGTLLNYCRLISDQVFQKLAVFEQKIYAIMASYRDGVTTQKLVSLSPGENTMMPQTILDLSGLPEDDAADIVWQSMTMTDDGNILLGGKGAHGNGYSLSLDLETGGYQIAETLQEKNVLFLSQRSRQQILWVSDDGQVHWYHNGQQTENILDGQSATPQQPMFCEGEGFLSDSITGDIYKIEDDGTAWLFRKGSDVIARSGHTYEEYSAYTVYPDAGGSLRVAGVCRSDTGGSVVGEEWSIDTLRYGSHRLLLLWQHGWPVALAILVVLLLTGLWFGRILHSPRLSTRLTLCELTAAVFLLLAVTVIQYRTYQTTLLEEAHQTLHLLGGSLAVSLESDAQMTDQELRNTVKQMHDQLFTALTEEGKTYTLRVIWKTPNGPAIGYDDTMPPGYLLEDVETHNYLSAVNDAFHSNGTGVRMLRGEISTNYLYVQTFRQGDRAGCVTVSLPREILFRGQTQFFQRMVPILAACPVLFVALLWVTRRLLMPLNTIRDALEEFYASGGGNQMVLSDMPRTELYEVGRVFNQLSLETKTQFNALKAMNDAYRRLVPNSMLHILGKSNVSDLGAGDRVTVNAALLVIAASEPDQAGNQIMALINYAAESVGTFGGVVVDHDEGLDSLTALFADSETALACARAFMTDQKPVTAAVLQESVVFGVFGGTHLLFPLALTPYMARRFDVIALMRRFGAKVIRCGQYAAGLRLLGWDDELAFYEETVWRPPDWQSVWQNVDALWAQALELYRQRKFSSAMRKFAGILRAMPGDEAAHWYLFRCEALRDAGQEEANIDLLYGWEGNP